MGLVPEPPQPKGPETSTSEGAEKLIEKPQGPEETVLIEGIPDIPKDTAAAAVAKIIDPDKELQDITQTNSEDLTPAEAGKRVTLTDDEVRQLVGEARKFVEEHPLDEDTPFVELSYTPIDLEHYRQLVPFDLGRRFDAHGIAKGMDADQLRALDNFLTNGIDHNRNFDSTALRSEDENGSYGGPYTNGSFVIIGRPDNSLWGEGIAGVLVQEHFYGAIPTLQEKFPNVKFIRADQMEAGLREMLPSPAEGSNNSGFNFGEETMPDQNQEAEPKLAFQPDTNSNNEFSDINAALSQPLDLNQTREEPLPEDPDQLLSFLKQNNPDNSYSEAITPVMVQKAVDWAKEKGVDPTRLSEAQITLAQDYVPGEKTEAEIAEERIKERAQRLRDNKEQLMSILAPSEGELFHATEYAETADKILNEGLLADSVVGLGGSALGVRAVPPDADPAIREQIIEDNIQLLSNPHKGYRYEVIIDLPQLTTEQKADMQRRISRGENTTSSAYFVYKLPIDAGVRGVERTYNAILPSTYVKGYLDLDTGQFIPKSPQAPPINY